MAIIEDIKYEIDDNDDYKQFGRFLRGMSVSMLCIGICSVSLVGLMLALKITNHYFNIEYIYADYLNHLEGIWIGLIISCFIIATLIHTAKKRNPIFWAEHSQIK
jgi:hypothetical protein